LPFGSLYPTCMRDFYPYPLPRGSINHVGLFIVVALPLSRVTIHGSVYRLPCEQYKGANPLRATFPQQSSTLRVSDWLDSVSRQALRHFHHTPAATLQSYYFPIESSIVLSGRVLPLLNGILSHQIQHDPVSVHLRLLGLYSR
jgi:hypothetical protein